MPGYDHIIMRLCLELSIVDTKSQQNIQQLIQQVLEHKIPPLLDQIFSLYVPDDVLITLDQLQIDLGELDPQAIEHTIFQQIQHKLPAIIKEHIDSVIQDPLKRHIVPLRQAKLEAIQYYLKQGYFVWWMPAASQDAIEALYTDLLIEAPQDIQGIWLQLSQSPQAINRFVKQFALNTIQKTLHILEPGYALKIIHIAQDLATLQQVIKLPASNLPIVGTPSVWGVVMHQVLSPQLSKFNEWNIIQASLKKLAQEYHTNYQTFVLKINQILNTTLQTESFKSNLPNLIVQLHESLAFTKPQATPESEKLPVLIRELDKALAQENIAQQDLSNIIDKILSLQDSTTKPLLRGYIQSQLNSHRLVNSLNDGQMAGVVAILQPAIQGAFETMRALWKKMEHTELRSGLTRYLLIERLTLNYLVRDMAADQEPHSYLRYLWHKLPLYRSQSLGELQALLRSGWRPLNEHDTGELITLVLTSLEDEKHHQRAIEQPKENSPKEATFKEIHHEYSVSDQGPAESIETDLLNERVVETLDKSLVDKSSGDETRGSDTVYTLEAGSVGEQTDKAIDQNLGPVSAPHSIEKKLLSHLVDSDLDNLIPDILGRLTNKPVLLVKAELQSSLKNLWLVLDRSNFQEQLTLEQKKKLVQAFRAFLAVTIEDRGLSAEIASKLEFWVDQWVESPIKLSGLVVIKQQLERILKDLELVNLDPKTVPSIQEIEAFLVEGYFPPSYASQAELLEAIIRLVTQQEGVKKALLSLLKRKVPRQNLIHLLFEEDSIGMNMLGPLIPLGKFLFKKYSQLLLQADVLRAGPMSDKRQLLADFFLVTASQTPDVTETAFIQLTLFNLSQHSQLSKQEFYRRIYLAAEKIETPAGVMRALEPLASASSPQDIVGPLEIALLAIYEKIKNVWPQVDIILPFHTTLLPAMREAINQGITPSNVDKMVSLVVKKAYPTIQASDQKEIVQVIKPSLQQIIITHQQHVQEAWSHFLHTGELITPYKTPVILLNELLSQPRSEVQPILIEHIETDYTRKRLVGSLAPEDLSRLVRFLPVQPTDSLLGAIERIGVLWDYADMQNAKYQFKLNTWWEIALANLVNLRGPSFTEKTWLASSLSALAKKLDLHPNVLLHHLNTVMQGLGTKSSTEKHSDLLLLDIRRDWSQEMDKSAKQAWPKQPTLQILDKLLTIGLSTLTKPMSLDQLQEELHPMISQQGEAIKKLLYNQAQSAVVAQRLAYYFSSELVELLIQLLDGQAYLVMKAYLAFSTLPVSQVNMAMDQFAWRKHNEVAILTYLLEKHPSPFNQEQWLAQHIDLLNQYTHQASEGIFRKLINYHQATTAYQELSQALSELLAAGDSIFEPSLQKPAEIETSLLDPNLADTEQLDQEIKIYIKNSGLIFLWPFMEDLLVKQELMENQVFVDNMAANNAIHMLQYLATEQLRTPDWRIILNKLLCGLAYDEITPLGYYLPEERKLAVTILEELKQEKVNTKSLKSLKKLNRKKKASEIPAEILLLQQNCQELMDTVLAAWPSLKNLEKFEPYKKGFTVEDFKAYFLQREGILQRVRQADKEYWHLTLTVDTYDSPDILPPWPIQSIRLPWMQEELIVFWMGD